MLNHQYRMKWWGWGKEGVNFNLANRLGIIEYMQNRLGVENIVYEKHFDWREVQIPPSHLSPSLVELFRSHLGSDAVCSDDYERILHAFGKSYRDAIRIRSLKIDNAPDLVLYPANKKGLQEILTICEENNIAVVPFGGGTSVVGGLEALTNAGASGAVVSVDLARLNRITCLEERALYISVEAGKFGPELEAELNAHGYTLGHFPQSFEFSTVGGWVATRSAGQNSTHYGKIEDLVIGLEIVTPRGILNIPASTHRACGPDIKNLLIGSEGRLGIISEVRLKISKAPRAQKYVGYFFANFQEATTAARELLQKGIVPALLRISDEEETESMIQLNSKPQSLSKKLQHALGFSYMAARGFGAGKRVLMMVGLEGDKNDNELLHVRINKVFSKYSHLYMGTSIGKSWLKERFFLPYLRDDFLNNHILIDTLETATTWENIETLHDKVVMVISETFSRQGVPHSVFAHISHLYKEGASLYFTFVAKQQKGRELEQWTAVKRAASETIIAFGAPISHHHGIGADHLPFLRKALGELESKTLHALKEIYDPKGIMNPGKLL